MRPVDTNVSVGQAISWTLFKKGQEGVGGHGMHWCT